MTPLSERMVEAAARAIWESSDASLHVPYGWDGLADATRARMRHHARAALAAVIPAIQAEALERAAVVADDKAAAYDRRWEAERKYSGRDASATADQRATALQLATAIRALKEVVNPATSFPQPQRKDGHPPCYECHLQPGEKCDVCGAVKPKEPTP